MEHLVIADTDVIIDYFSARETFSKMAAELILKDSLALTSITVFELYAGVAGARRLAQIDNLVALVPVFPFRTEDALAAVGIYNDLKKRGKLIGIRDILIAGICISRKAPLLTGNKDHFSRIHALKLL
ncbi:MAG: type II toxin-antitoxin system VapC family toxin [Syntrophobacteraceae bacterium]